MLKFCVSPLAALLIALAFAPAAAFARAPASTSVPATGDSGAGNPVVIELFVSQACGACYEASDIAREVAQSADALLLTYPIDYWDYRGWKDTFARPEHKARQESYRRRLANRRLYTPQAVVQGAVDVRGDARNDLYLALDAAPVSRVQIISAEMTEDELRLSLAAADLGEEVEIWIAPFAFGDRIVDIATGENKGRRMTFKNVVSGLKFGGMWDGAGGERVIDLGEHDGADACAVIIQERDVGRILAVAVAGPDDRLTP